MHRFLAEEGSSDSQLYLALKLAEEAREESNPSKAEIAVEWLVESAKNGNKMAIKALEECLQTKSGITDKNLRQVLSCLSRSEAEVRAEGLSRTIMTTVSDEVHQFLPQSRFKHRLRRMLQTGVSKEVPSLNKDDIIITEHILSYNIKHILTNSNPVIDLTDDLEHNNLFTLMFRVLQGAFEVVDHFLIISLLVMMCLSLIFNYIFFSPNVILLYRNLFKANTIRLSLQFLQVLAFARIMNVINRYNNYKLWVKLLRIVDHEFPSDQTKYFKKTVKPIAIFIIVLMIELYYNQWRPESQPQSGPTLVSSVVRPLMALFSFLTLIRHHIDLIQIFFVIIHFLSRHYLQQIQTMIPYFDYYSSDYSLLLSILVVIFTTKTIFNYVTLNLIIIPNLLVHILISFTDFTTEPLNPISAIIPFNIHLIFGTILLILIMKITGKLKILYQLVVVPLIFTDFYFHFTKEINFYYPFSVVFIICLMRKVRRRLIIIGFRDWNQLIKVYWYLCLLLVLVIPLLFTYGRQSSIKVNTMKAYSYDTFYDNCLNEDLSRNITKQIECIDITIEYKLNALSSIASVRVSKVSNSLRQIIDFATLDLNQYFAQILSNFYEFNLSLKEWRIFEYEVTFTMQHNNKPIFVSLDHLSRDFIDKLKVNDIYEIEFIYDSIRNSAILLSAKCKTCWDVVHWNNTVYMW